MNKTISKYVVKYTAVALLPAFLLTACGGGTTSNTSTPQTSGNKTTPPEKIDFDLPSTLISSSSASRSPKYASRLNTSKRESSVTLSRSIQSYAYGELKQQLSDANFRRLETNISLLYLDAIWNQIEQNCSSVPVDTRCDIPANTVSFAYTQAIFNAEYALYESQDDYFSEVDLVTLKQEMQSAVGFTLPLGEINYTVHSTGTFTHDVTIDLSNIKQIRKGSSGTLKQQAKWNADKTRVFTGYYYSEDGLNSTTSFIDWDKSLDVINYQDISDYSGYKVTFKSKVTNLNDGKNGVLVNSSWADEGPADEGTFIYKSEGRINDEGGNLESVTSYLSDKYYTEETFDGSGQRTGGKYCDSQTADCSNKDNWSDDSDYLPIIDPVIDPLEPINPEEPTNPETEDSSLLSDVATVTGLPDDVEFFVITQGNVTSPDFDDVLCIGSNFSYEEQSFIDVACWSDRVDELDANAKVFQEVFNESAPIDGEFLSYTEIPTASVVITE